MTRSIEFGFASLAVLVLSAAAAMAQVAPPLSTTPGPRVAPTPAAPTVKAGRGGGASTPGPGAGTPLAPAAAPAAVRPPTATPEQVAAQQASIKRIADLRWPQPGGGLYVETGVNHFTGQIVWPDGKTQSLAAQNFPGGPLPLMTEVRMGLLIPDGGGAMMVGQEGDGLKVYATFTLKDGRVIDPPPLDFALVGGTRTVSLADGGQLTFTLDGAHPLTAEEQTYVDRAKARRAGAAAPSSVAK